MSESIFSQIVSGELPCHKVFEDDKVLAFLDTKPLSPGHTIVIPKRPVITLDKLDGPDATALGAALPKIAKAVMKITGAHAYNLLQNNGADAGQAIFHVHFHIIPRYKGKRTGAGLSFDWKPGKFDEAGAPELAAKIKKSIR